MNTSINYAILYLKIGQMFCEMLKSTENLFYVLFYCANFEI